MQLVNGLKKLIAFLLDKANVSEEDINIIFNDNIPVSEYQNILTAQAKKTLGFSLKSIAMEYFGLTEEQADQEVEMAREESASSFIEQLGAVKNNGFGDNANKGNTNPDKDDGEGKPNGEKNEPPKGKQAPDDKE